MKKLFFMLTLLLIGLCTGCTKNVKDYDLTVTFQNQELLGKYTGPLVDDVATTDSAVFVYKNGDNYLNYTGGFKDGQFSGKGTLETNILTVHFNDVDRIGEFKGDVVNGIPKGQGEFTATNDQNKTYTYIGEWDNGTFNGYGKRTYEDEQYSYEGSYINGEYTPTKLEFLKFIGQYKPNGNENATFNMSDKTIEFIKNNDSIFPTNNFDNIKNLIDTSIEFKHLMKNTDNYSGKLIKFDNGYVGSIWEDNSYGQDISIIQVANSDMAFYYIYYFGKLDNIFTGDKVLVYGLPLAPTSFTNVGNTTTQAVVLLGSYITKK